MTSQTRRKRVSTSGQTPLLPFPVHGGARKGAGRPRSNPRPRVAHVARSTINPLEPLLVTVRLRPGLPNARGAREMTIVWSTLRSRRSRSGFRAIHASVQTNHLHAIVEADSSLALSRGMQGLLDSLARRWNRLWGLSGSVFDGAYHARPLASPREVRSALVYVLHNGRKHDAVSATALDPCSSAWWFDGWGPGSVPPPASRSRPAPRGTCGGVAASVRTFVRSGRTWQAARPPAPFAPSSTTPRDPEPAPPGRRVAPARGGPARP